MMIRYRLLAEELRLRAYSQKTVKAYCSCVGIFLKFCDVRNFGSRNRPYLETPQINSRIMTHVNSHKITPETIRTFILLLHETGKASQTINLYLSAIKFFCRHVLHVPFQIDVPFAKRSKKLPAILSREEIQKLISQIKNGKHRLLISLAYGAGLRVSEVVNLRAKDLLFDERLIFIRQAKGKKDRMTILPDALMRKLPAYCATKTPNDFVFSSERGGKLTTRTAQKVFANSCAAAEISKPVTFHSLRHSFATHILENGVDIRCIQELLGHQNIRTTQGYTRVTGHKLGQIKSPLY